MIARSVESIQWGERMVGGIRVLGHRAGRLREARAGELEEVG